MKGFFSLHFTSFENVIDVKPVVKKKLMNRRVGGGGMDGWMTCCLTSFSTVFLSYQNGGQMIMKSR